MNQTNDEKHEASETLNEEEVTQEQEVKEPSLEESVASLKKDLEKAKQDYLLTLADAENTRKRVQKEKYESIKFAQEGLISDFLTPMDNFENALGFAQNTSKEMQQWAQGFAMILDQFKDILNRHNVHPFSAQGELFNPHLHEVIEIESTSDTPPNTIIKEFTKGYKCGDRILRAARVKVTKSPKDEVSEDTDQNSNEKLNENKKEA